MKIAKNIGDPIYTKRRDVIDNYFLVDDDYDFILNNKEDITSISYLTNFHGIGRMDYRLFRQSLINNILPNWNELTASERKQLIFNRVKPIDFTDNDVINEIGEEGLDYINRNISEYELIETVEVEKEQEIDAIGEELLNRLSKNPNEWIEFPLVEKFIEGDYLLIEDGEDGGKKKRISKDVFAEAVTGGFGQYSSYAESLNATSTTSTAWQNKLSFITPSDAVESTYRIGWTLQITNSNNNQSTEYRVTVDGNVIDVIDVILPRAGSYLSFAAFQHLVLTTGSHTINVDFRRGSGGTASIQNVRVEFWRAAEDEE